MCKSASNPPLSFLQARCPSCHKTNSVKALRQMAVRSKTLFQLNSPLVNKGCLLTHFDMYNGYKMVGYVFVFGCRTQSTSSLSCLLALRWSTALHHLIGKPLLPCVNHGFKKEVCVLQPGQPYHRHILF